MHWNDWVQGEPATNAELAAALRALPPVDPVVVGRRCDVLWSRSIKADSQLAGLELAIRTIDLTTLEGADTPERVRALCLKAVRPEPGDPTCPPVAAVCVGSDLVGVAVDAVTDTQVAVAGVAAGFPAGRTLTEAKVLEVAAVVAAGAEEVDIVIDRGALLAGDYRRVLTELRELRAVAGDALIKTILEVGELGDLDQVRRASWLAMAGGADMIKTSTGRIGAGADPRSWWVMADAVRSWRAATGRTVGLKVAGGIRTAKDALRYLLIVADAAGPDWLAPARVRIGASGLLDDLLAQRRHRLAGYYPSPDEFTRG